MTSPGEVLARLAADLPKALGDQLLSVALHGSWVLGDFAPGRSDLDMLAVMATDPTAATLARLDDMHTRLADDFPDWDGHVEVEYVSVGAIEAVVQGTDELHPTINIGPGTPLQRFEASRRNLLNWADALRADRPLAGAAPSSVLPVIDRQLVHQEVLQRVRTSPHWLDGIDDPGPGDQAYTVLTLCRAAEALTTGRHVSKRAAAHAAMSRFPEWPGLIDWARQWWYERGSDSEVGQVEDMRRFVIDVSARLLQLHDPSHRASQNTTRSGP